MSSISGSCCNISYRFLLCYIGVYNLVYLGVTILNLGLIGETLSIFFIDTLDIFSVHKLNGFKWYNELVG